MSHETQIESLSQEALVVLREALKLSERDRGDLASHLIASLDSQVDPDPGVEAAWDEEIGRRIKELDEGTVKCIPWESAREFIFGEADEPTAD